MEILILEPLVPPALAWLQDRHAVSVQPELAQDPQALRQALHDVRAAVLPRQTAVTKEFLSHAPMLRAVARLHDSSDNTDLEACRQHGCKVLYASRANVRSNAEFLLGGLLMLMRRGMAESLGGKRHVPARLGRELQGSTVGLLGLSPVAQSLADLLRHMGVQLTGYDPAIHYSSPLWARLGIKPVSLPELMSGAQAISVQMLYASRYRGFINQQTLAFCRPGQLWVSTSRSELFDAQALAGALTDGRIDACLIDGADSGFAARGTPLHSLDNLHLTPRLGANTHEARLRASWYIAHRMHEALMGSASAARFEDSGATPEQPGLFADEPIWARATA